MAEHRPGTPYRYRHGWVKIVPDERYRPIHKRDLSTPDARRSREVSPGQFQKIAARGAAQYQQYKRASSPSIFERSQPGIANRAFTASREPWGGATIDAHTGEFLSGSEDKYALTVRDPGMKTISVDPRAGAAEFRKKFEEATKQYSHILARKDHYLGVFHDADKNTIDIDPVFVTSNKEHTETIGAYTHAVGGAYHFKSGDGFWPPHVKETRK